MPAPEHVYAQSPAACVHTRIGLDLRALPRGTSAQGIDGFTRAQADVFRAGVRGASPRILHTPGFGGFEAIFEGDAARVLLTTCQDAVTAYMRQAPHLPISMEPAAHVTTPCAPCE